MKSSIVKPRAARGLLVALGCVTVVAGFMACSGDSTRRTGRNNDRNNGGDGATQAGAGGVPGSEQGGSASTVTAGGGGVPSEAGSGALAGESFGGVPGASGGAGEPAGGTGGNVDEGGAAGESSVAGQTSVGGESSIGGESSVGGQSQGGAGGEGGAPFVDPICGVNMVQVGAYSLWCGKVNMHLTEQGAWTHDLDCSSGCNVTGVTYCQKFYPTATAVATVAQTVFKDWKNAGCAESTPDGPGVSGEAVCCAPAP